MRQRSGAERPGRGYAPPRPQPSGGLRIGQTVQHAKFGLGVIQLGAGFLVLVAGANAVGLGNAVPVIFIFLILV